MGKKVLVGVLFLFLLGLVFYFFIYNPNNKQEEQVVEVLDEINSYGYVKQDNDTVLFEGLFEEIKIVLNEEVINEEEYVKLVAKMFIVDLYTLDNKLSRNDVGGTEFVHSTFEDNYILNATDTLYKYVENDIYGDRNQDLPIVSTVEVTAFEIVNYEYNDLIDDSAYEVDLTWTYEVDLGYETETTLYIVHEDNKLVVVEME